jgi:hypothetical protein
LIKKLKKYFLFCFLLCSFSFLSESGVEGNRGGYAPNRMFKTWIDGQIVFSPIKISSMIDSFNKKNVKKLKILMKRLCADLLAAASFFDFSEIHQFISSYKIPTSKQMEKKISPIYALLDGDVSKFIAHLEKNNFSTKLLSGQEKKQDLDTVSKKHTDWMEILFFKDDRKIKDEFLFNVANKFFEFCFYPETFDQFKKLLADRKKHPIIRFLYSTMWTNLAGYGWQHWHADSLANLRKEADAGKEILYVAGGTDIYQLIGHGIYNIRVVDPILPSQPRYYSENWDLFIKGNGDNFGIGEVFSIPCKDKNLTMKRISFEPTGDSFSMTLSNKKRVKINKSITTWHLFDDGKKVGQVVFDRRLTNQKDFENKKNTAILMSFNELYYVALPKERDGWRINPNKFNKDIKIFIKQLEKPINKKVVCNMRYEAEQPNFSFMGLGSCVD